MRAIILAAGMGTRLRPLTNDIPKALVKVNGIPMIERQIEFLLFKGIKEIIVVTGYLKDKFNYLEDKYGVLLVHNDKFEKFNNIYSMYLVKSYLPEAYVLEGDVFINNNVIETFPQASMYFCNKRKEFKNEWIVFADPNNRVTSVEVGDGRNTYILSGISYWNKEDGSFIVKKLEEAVETGEFSDLYWDDIVKQNISHLNVLLRKLEETDSFEIDSMEDLQSVEQILQKV